MQFNKEELFIGAVLGLGFFWMIGWWCILLAIATSILYERGGSGWLGTKLWRRLLLPISVGITLKLPLIQTVLAIMISFGILSIGYGSRSTQPPDEGSPFGNLCLKLAGEVYGKWLARATIIVAIWLVYGGAYLAKTWK